jgi:glycogen debranching enzyme GlgX
LIDLSGPMTHPARSKKHVKDSDQNTAVLSAGRPWPLGAHFDGQGINFAVASSEASRIELCLFDDTGTYQLATIALPACTHDVWHGFLAGAQPGLIYGLRAHGDWQPALGLRFNAHKLLLDPYARNIVGQYEWRDEHFAHHRAAPNQIDTRDNAAWGLKARVPKPDAFSWEDDQLLHTPLVETVIYELHVKGFSKTNPRIPEAIRGTFAGLAHPASIEHLQRLGITAVNLLPVHYALDEERLVTMGLSNYWGYNTLGFFALNPKLVSAASRECPQDEFRNMVKALHRAGIEVLLDVVYNHTAESDETGPSLSFRGLDNSTYYRLPENQPAHYENHTGCGNTMDLRKPRVLQLVLDSLRYWVEDMHVDGFRFDLATVLGRGDHGFEAASAFFKSIAQDPVLSRVKLIAEPWDIGPGGYQVGQFPDGWQEWNDQFRDTVRRFWLHRERPENTRGEFAMRLCGSADLYQQRRRTPSASINYVVSHDGFTLRDLVSFEERHNLANGEDNRDGHRHNLSFNCGVEGPSIDPEVNALRAKLQRALLATTLLSQGTPMLCAGDELGHSQRGNNNPYCQDNETTWIDWEQADQTLIRFTSHLIMLRKLGIMFARDWHDGLANADGDVDLTWLKPDGGTMLAQDWQDRAQHAIACLIIQSDKSLLAMLFNPQHGPQHFVLPGDGWQVVLDSSSPDGLASPPERQALSKSGRVLEDSTSLKGREPSSRSAFLVDSHCIQFLKQNPTS